MKTEKNVLYIHTHDTGRVLSPYGYQVPTPAIQEFADDALLFRKCFAAAPTCSPSRAAMLTGMYPHENGMLGLAQRGFSIDYSKHLVQYLNRHNYCTVLSGIQHESGWYLNRDDAAKIGYRENLTAETGKYRDEDLVYWDMENAESAADWLKACDKEQPFFMSYGMHATHRKFPDWLEEGTNPAHLMPPVSVPDFPEAREDYARFVTSVKWADRCFGKVIQALKDSGLYENTIILFTTDHGIPFPYHKCTLFDAGIGVNFMLRVPGMETSGQATDSLISHLDVFPTLCELLELPVPAHVKGVSFAPVVRDTKVAVRDEIFAEVTFHTSYEPIRCIRTERYKYIRYYDEEYLKINQSNTDESPTKDFFNEKGMAAQTKYREALYDLVFDNGEHNNCMELPQYREVYQELSEKLDMHLRATHDKILTGAIAVKPSWKVNKKECLRASSKNPDDYVSFGEQ